MKNPNLIPTAVTDKNGKLTTVHKKQGQSKMGSKSVPAPRLAAPVKKKPVKAPLAKQLEHHSYTPYQNSINPDPELAKVLGAETQGMLWFMHSQVQALDVMSVVGVDDAMAFFSQNFRDSETVLALLRTYGLERLIVDRREMMDEALSLRVDPTYIMKLNEHYPLENYDPEVYLTAAKIAQSVSFPQYDDDAGDHHTFHDSLLKDEISHHDLKSLGQPFIMANKSFVEPIHVGLHYMHSGKGDYGVDTIKYVIEHSSFPAAALDAFVRMIPEHGTEFVMQVDDIGAAYNLERSNLDRSAEDRRSLIMYQQHGSTPKKLMHAHLVPALHDAGVPPEMARKLLGEGMDVQSIIEAHNAGIKTAVADGWL